jgi:citrate/tricarballylate utilization protein
MQTELQREGEHMMSVCNACRYCEALCAVWPAMEFRRAFNEHDLNYLANLCHNCSECYYACQYAPPHEWKINSPLTFAKIRNASWEQYAWPKPLAKAFRYNGLITALLTAVVLALFIFGVVNARADASWAVAVPGGDFYAVTSHDLLTVTFSAVALFVLLALGIGLVRFWRDVEEKMIDLVNPPALLKTLKEVLRLEYLDERGWGCTYPGEMNSQSLRWFHHITFYGFLLCFAATTTGFIYHYGFHWYAPYGYTSLPVILGTLGGLGLLVGPIGLWVLKSQRNPEISDERGWDIDVAFLVMLLLTSATGLLLLVLRETAGMSLLLAFHLGFVMALFLMLPYGKFVHAVYRSAAILKYSLERARKETIGV